MSDNENEIINNDSVEATAAPEVDTPDVAPAAPEAPVAPAPVAPVIAPKPVENKASETPVAPVIATAAAAAVDDKAKKAEAKKAADQAKKEAKKNAAKAKKEAKKNEKIAAKKAKIQAKIDACPREYKPLSTSKCFWLIIFGGLPVIGLIVSLITSIIPFNKNIKYVSRALFALHLIGIILLLIGGLIAVYVAGASVTDIINIFVDFFEEISMAVSF